MQAKVSYLINSWNCPAESAAKNNYFQEIRNIFMRCDRQYTYRQIVNRCRYRRQRQPPFDTISVMWRWRAASLLRWISIYAINLISHRSHRLGAGNKSITKLSHLNVFLSFVCLFHRWRFSMRYFHYVKTNFPDLRHIPCKWQTVNPVNQPQCPAFIYIFQHMERCLFFSCSNS